MKFLTDENVKGRLVKWLQTLGYNVTMAPKGVRNSQLFELAKQTGQVLISNDKDFLNSALYPIEGTPGRIILRIFPPTFESQRTALEGFFVQVKEGECVNKLVELWREGFEMRMR